LEEEERVLKQRDEKFEQYPPTYDIKLKCGGSVTLRKPAKRYGNAHRVTHRTWNKCTKCLSRNFGLVVDAESSFYCYHCFEKKFKMAEGEFLLPKF
jgi:hypothetical protein